MKETNPLTEIIRPHVKSLIADAAAGDRNADALQIAERSWCTGFMSRILQGMAKRQI